MTKEATTIAVPSGEHIFPEYKIRPAVLQWRRLVELGKQQEALELLDVIITDCTEMFKRLAQYEKFHHTVSLDHLVSAAQEKIPKWITKWDPAIGSLFTWLSKSLTGDTPILMADGSQRLIKDLVDSKSKDQVISWDEQTKSFVSKPIVAWHKHPADKRSWRKLSVKHPAGYIKRIYATHDHEFLTQRGWVEVDCLCKTDTLFIKSNEITREGIDIVIGMYLGDGSLTPDYGMSVSHCEKQKGYSEHVASLFGLVVHPRVSTAVKGGKEFPAYSYNISLRDIWNFGVRKLSRKKKINKFVLDNLTERAVAYWFMDDGACSKTRRITLHTESFSKADTLKLIKALKLKFGLNSWFVPRKNKPYGFIQLRPDSVDTFLNMVAKYVVPCMRYKLVGHDYPEFSDSPVVKSIVAVASTFKSTVVHGNTGHIKVGKYIKGEPCVPDWKFRYDITVPDTENFIANGIISHNCSKNAFRTEVIKVVTYGKRFHSTDDMAALDRLSGFEDHSIDKDDVAAELNRKLHDMTCPWSSVEVRGCIRYLIECILDDNHSRTESIRGASFAWGVPFETAKFLYNWVIVQLRDAFYKKVMVPMSEQDLLRCLQPFSHQATVMDIVGFDKYQHLVATMGGFRMRFPTINEVRKAISHYRLYRELLNSDQDPDTFSAVAKKAGKTDKTAAEIFSEMASIDIASTEVSGEFPVYDTEIHRGDDEE